MTPKLHTKKRSSSALPKIHLNTRHHDRKKNGHNAHGDPILLAPYHCRVLLLSRRHCSQACQMVLWIDERRVAVPGPVKECSDHGCRAITPQPCIHRVRVQIPRRDISKCQVVLRSLSSDIAIGLLYGWRSNVIIPSESCTELTTTAPTGNVADLPSTSIRPHDALDRLVLQDSGVSLCCKASMTETHATLSEARARCDISSSTCASKSLAQSAVMTVLHPNSARFSNSAGVCKSDVMSQ
jgi:hypothetical protein